MRIVPAQNFSAYRIILVLLIAAIPAGGNFASAQEQKPIPDAVYLHDNWVVEVNPTRGILLDISRKVRVNSPRGRSVGRLKIWETFYRSLKRFDGVVTDSAGNAYYTVTKDELESGYPFSDYRLYSNDRLFSVDLTAPTFPYFIEYSYRLQIDNTFFWPDWEFPDAYPREYASYAVAVPHRFGYRTHPVYPNLTVDSNRTLKRDVIVWSSKGLTVDSLTGGGQGTYPVMYVAPSDFSVARQRGSTDSWAELGRWYWELTRKRARISGKQKEEVQQWPGQTTDPQQILSLLKDAVSQNWRYVAIEVGIGGWRPHKAEAVYQSRYGDCKDLTYLWLAVSDVFDIRVYPALVRARNPQPLLPDFPKDWFDHVVGVAIVGDDTLWADLTTPGYPLGRLPYQVEDRNALVILPDGGALWRTPATVPTDNKIIRTLKGRLSPEGDLSFEMRATVSGHKLAMFGGGAAVRNDSRKAAEVLGVLPGRLRIDTVQFAYRPEQMSATINATGEVAEWSESTRKRFIFPLDLAGWASPQPLYGQDQQHTTEKRPYPALEIDTLIVVLPPGYLPEFLPEDIALDQADALFDFSTSVAGDTLLCVRYYEYRANRASRTAGKNSEALRRAISALRYADAVFVREPDSTDAR